MVALLAQALVLAAVADALVAPTRPRPSRVARGAHGDGPLLSVPIPGSASATLQVLRDPASASAPRATRELFEELGATFVKLGQLVASSPTLFPEAWTAEFEKTLDGAPPVPYATVKRVVEASLGTTIAAAFSTFDEAPLATASVAQVHAATLRNGDRVVVKVLKPGVRDTLTADLVFLNGAAKILEAVAPETKRVSLADVAAQLRDSTLQELDLREEARRLRSFRGFLASSGLDQAATCPLPYEDLSSKEVLTMTRLDGSRLVDADASNPASEAAVATVIRTWARSVVEHDFFHADVHGGNVLLLRDGTVGIIDFGIVGTLPRRSTAPSSTSPRPSTRGRDYGGIADALRGMGVADGATFDREKFAGDLRRAFDAVEANDAAAIVGDVIAVSEDNNLVLPREFGLLTKQAVYLNRYVTTPRRTSTFRGDLPAGSAAGGGGAAAPPQKQSFEDADHALRHALYDCYLAEGSYKEAACTLGGIDVETCSKPYADLDKAALYVKIAETFLEDDESVDAETYVNRASGLMHAVDGKVHWALQLRYRMEQSDAFAAHARVLKRMFTGQVVRTPEIAAFTATLLPHQKALLGDGLTIPEKAMIQHNLAAVSLVYVNASLREVGALLDIDPRRAEQRFDDPSPRSASRPACYDKISALSDEATSAAAA
ncbi:hypothetical protein JL722_2581 [Aureococcus anophagefferens]|nr:hypothetical protein JL722_2581 [Aureococcus anophagefferens]